MTSAERPGGQSALVSPVAARVAAEHGIDLAQVKTVGNRVQKEDVLAHLSTRSSALSSSNTAVPASPKARRLASERNLDLATINGSGPGGAVLAADVLSVSEHVGKVKQIPWAASPQPASVEIPVSRMWKIMAERLTQSWTSTPHFSLERDVDAERLMAWRVEVQGRASTKVTYTDLLVKVVAIALRAHPRLNASWRDERIVANGDINIGIAIAVEEGLLVPVIQDADTTGLNDDCGTNGLNSLTARRMVPWGRMIWTVAHLRSAIWACMGLTGLAPLSTRLKQRSWRLGA